MRLLASVLLCLSSCALERDLSEERFACGLGGPCEDAGVFAADSGVLPDAGLPACDPLFGAPTACGGDPVGRFQYAEVCASGYLLEEVITNCPGAQGRERSVSVSGGLVVGSGMWVPSCAVALHEVLYVPPSCLTLIDCATLGGIVRSMSPLSLSGCVTEDPGCVCTLNLSDVCATSGAYTVQGTDLVVDSDTYPFCARDGALIYATDPPGNARPRVFVLRRL